MPSSGGDGGRVEVVRVVQNVQGSGQSLPRQFQGRQAGHYRPGNALLDLVAHQRAVARGRQTRGEHAGDGKGRRQDLRGIPDQQAGGGRYAVGAPAAGGQGVQSAEIPGPCHAHGHLVSGAQGRHHVPAIGAGIRSYRQHRRNDGGAGVAAGPAVAVVQVKGAAAVLLAMAAPSGGV